MGPCLKNEILSIDRIVFLRLPEIYKPVPSYIIVPVSGRSRRGSRTQDILEHDIPASVLRVVTNRRVGHTYGRIIPCVPYVESA